MSDMRLRKIPDWYNLTSDVAICDTCAEGITVATAAELVDDNNETVAFICADCLRRALAEIGGRATAPSPGPGEDPDPTGAQRGVQRFPFE